MANLSTENDINRGIQKLNARIAELETIDPSSDPWHNGTCNILSFKIRSTIREVFGEESEEYSDYRNVLYDNYDTTSAVNVLRELKAWLEEKRMDLTSDPVAQADVFLRVMSLHPEVAGKCMKQYENGDYEEAVLNASKALIQLLKDKSGRYDLDGDDLVNQVFSEKKPVLVFGDLGSKTWRDYHLGMTYLFKGAVAAIRNPRAHSFVGDSAEEALEYIGLLSLLAKRLDEARKAS
ncbi:MAG: TIGR02391 family protein [Chloroflexi bacterium]|nr:TIGR02391 family protein [Chloroflexota bacterium]